MEENILKKRFQNPDEKKEAEYRQKAANRKRKSQVAKKKILDDTTAAQASVMNIFPYKSPESFGKALKRTFRDFFNSPKKSRCVIAGLTNHVGLKLQKNKQIVTGGKHKLDEVIKIAIKKFDF